MTDETFHHGAFRTRPARRWRDYLIFFGLFALMLVGLLAVARDTGWEETGAAISHIGWRELAILLLLSLVNYVLRALRWHLFARRLGLPTGYLQDLRHYFGGFAMSVTPGRVGELVRTRWIERETGWRMARTAPLVLVDRASDLAAMGALLGIMLARTGMGLAGALPVAVAALAAAVFATRASVLLALADVGFRLTGRFARFFVRLRHAAQSLAAFRPLWLTAAALALGSVGWLAEGWAFHLLLGWLGAEVRLAPAVAIFLFATLAGGLTGAPGGVGGAEAAMVALLTLQGVPPEISVPATLIIRVTTLWFAILIGLVVFPMAEGASRRARDALDRG